MPASRPPSQLPHPLSAFTPSAAGSAATGAPSPDPSPDAAPPRSVGLKVVVFDDDPTGSQTLHGCPLLLRWDAATLAAGLRHPSPFLFLLANTRALDPAAARGRIRSMCSALRPALEEAVTGGVIDRWLVVSRGDSTLRGHFPLELEEIAAALGPFDATLLVPAFLEGGRTTVDGVHLLEGRPVHETPFARDRLFGYSTSHLPDWVAEKTGGRIPAERVARLSLAELERGGAPLRRRLDALAASAGPAAVVAEPPMPDWAAGELVAVDAATADQLANLGEALRAGLMPGAVSGPAAPRLLFQSAASLLNALAPLPPQPSSAAQLATLRRRGRDGRPLPGLVVVGSHVPLADRQLARLLAEPACAGLEVPVARVHRSLEGPLPDRLLASLETEWLERLEALLSSGRTPVLHTSRGELPCRHDAERRRLGLSLAAAMARVVGRLAPRLGYLIAKGGITSHTLLEEGLQLAGVELQGQLLPGVSLVLAPGRSLPPWSADSGALDLPVVTFPGNLGDNDTLTRLWQLLEGGPADEAA